MSRTLLTLLLLAPAQPALAELYRWTDANGRVHFSDQAPPHQKAETLRKPLATPLGNSDEDNARLDRARRLSNAWQQEARRKESAELAAAEDKAQRQARCAEMRGQLMAAEGRRVVVTKANGEHAYLDDSSRQQFVAAANRTLQENCE